MHNVRIRGNGNRRIPLDTAMDLRGLLYFIIGIPVPIIVVGLIFYFSS